MERWRGQSLKDGLLRYAARWFSEKEQETMSSRPTSIAFNKLVAIAALALTLWLGALTAFGQVQQSNDAQELPPNQTIEREMTGAETHRYKFDLKANEFFQVRVEQKGVDVTLKLSDASGNVLATMDSPNSKEGPETLSLIAEKSGGFVLEVSVLDAKAEKGNYSIRREAARTATERDKRRVEVERLFVEGMTARSKEGQSETAIAKLKDALKGWRELEDSYLLRLTERQVKTLELVAELGIPNSLTAEGNKLIREGKPESILSARAKFIEAVEAARKLFKRLDGEDINDILSKDNRADLKTTARMGEINALKGIGNTYDVLKDWQESVNYNMQAIAVIREMQQDPEISASKALTSYVPLKVVEASSLFAIGTTLTSNLDKPQEGLSYDNQALTLWREVQREHEKYRTYAEFQEALILQTMAQSYLDLDDRDKAIKCFEQALIIFRRLPDQKSLAASILLQIGNAYSNQLDYEKARGAWDDALKIQEELGDKPAQASVLGLIGLSYFNVNDEQKAREYFNRALAILLSDDYLESAMKERSGMPLPDYKAEPSNISVFHKNEYEWQRAISIGNIYTILGDNEKGREYFEKSLTSARVTKRQNRIRLTLSLIGGTYERQEKWQEALNYYEQTLEISRLLPGKSDLAGDLSSLAVINIQLKRWQDALQNATEALLIYQSLGADKDNLFVGYAGALNQLARAQDGLGNRRLAIFYEKQAVNAIQRERQQLKNLNQQAQRGYLKKNEKPYRRLADWLIAAGRLPEAEQVLQMLKEDEYFRYVRGDAAEGDKLSQRADLNPTETDALKRYNEISNRLVEIGVEYAKLEEKKNRLPEGASLPPPEAKRFDELTKQITEANEGFQDFLVQLAREFARTPKANKVKDEAQQNSGLRSDLKRWRREFGDEGVVALYTVLGEDRYRVILTTPDAQIDGKSEINAEKFREKIAAFRQAVQDPQLDPRPLGKELYDIIVKPIEKQLDDAKAGTLLWSLDDTLRYVPIAALWDGHQYFGQKYQNVVITLASRTRLNERPEANWRVLGVGVSEPKQVNLTEPDGSTRSISFLALPAVREELQAIVRDVTSQGTETGVLPGRRLLNSTFTEAALKESLGKRYKVIHVASHFSFRPGDLTQSFLLLGDGQMLTLNKIKNNPQLAFTGVELLTLSACKTAVGETNADGAEVESFGVIAQETGAKAVLATLWSVADESTSLLMSKFYRLRKENPRLLKSEALQLAQKEMIEGKLQPQTATGEQRDTSELMDSKPNAPQFTIDPKKPYAHPYYWAPFILIGNWR